MEHTALLEKLTDLFRNVFNSDSLVLTNELTANDVDQWNSLSHMILIAEIEKTFSIQFKLKELNKMRNVGDLINMISSKLSA